MTKQQLLDTFATIKFHVSDAEDNVYCVASFGSDDTLSALADLMVFDEFRELEKLDRKGNVQLGDNGCPFESVADVTETLLEVFSQAIEDGLVTEDQIRSQVQVWPEGVSRSVFN